jgi:hypothetical protein
MATKNKKMNNSLKLQRKNKFKMQSEVNENILAYIESIINNPPNTYNKSTCTIDDGISIVSGLIKNQGDGTQALTPSIQYKASDFDSQLKAIQDLSNLYTDIYSKYPDVVWIYTALNVGSDSDINVSHQNWLCYNISTNTLYRFEPSVDYPEFRIQEFCMNISEILKSRLIQTIAEINHDNMCKAYSSLMIIYFILTRTNIKLYYDYKINSVILNTVITKLGNIYTMKNNPHPRQTRRSLGYIIY